MNFCLFLILCLALPPTPPWGSSLGKGKTRLIRKLPRSWNKRRALLLLGLDVRSPVSGLKSCSLPFGHSSLDNEGSDSELPPVTFSTRSRRGWLEERRQTRDTIPMKSLCRREKPPNFGYQRNMSPEEPVGGSRRAVCRPKPLFHVVDEEYESGEESEEEAPATGSRWSSEHGPSRDHHRSHSPLLRRK